MLRVFRSVVFIILLLGLSRGVGGQASPATPVELGDITEEAAAQFLAGEVAAVGDTVTLRLHVERAAPRGAGDTPTRHRCGPGGGGCQRGGSGAECHSGHRQRTGPAGLRAGESTGRTSWRKRRG